MSVLFRKGEFRLNAKSRLGKEASLPKLFTTGSFLYILTLSINKVFLVIEDDWDSDENFFNEVNRKVFECSSLFPNEIESFRSEKEHSETINAIHVNIRSLSKNCDNLLGILRNSNCSFNVLCITETWCTDLTLKNSANLHLFYKKNEHKSAEIVC